jgi:hypothetical protein
VGLYLVHQCSNPHHRRLLPRRTSLVEHFERINRGTRTRGSNARVPLVYCIFEFPWEIKEEVSFITDMSGVDIKGLSVLQDRARREKLCLVVVEDASLRRDHRDGAYQDKREFRDAFAQ